jgi:uncharacterized protein
MSYILSVPWFWPAAAIVLGSAAFQGASGFGMALIALPLLMALAGPQMAVPIITLAALIPPLVVLRVYRRHWEPGLSAWLGVPTLLTAPFGVHLLKIMTEPQLKMSLGAVLVGSAAWHFLKAKLFPRTFGETKVLAPGEKPRHSRVICVLIGAFSGVLGGAMGMTGPLIADFLIKSGISREAFKATLNLVFLASAVWRTGLYFWQGVTTGGALGIGVTLMPLALLGTMIGLLADKKIPASKFVGYTQAMLLLIGAWLFVNGWRS